MKVKRYLKNTDITFYRMFVLGQCFSLINEIQSEKVLRGVRVETTVFLTRQFVGIGGYFKCNV